MCRELAQFEQSGIVLVAEAMECVECVAMRERGEKGPTWWLHLRTCQTDGKTRCCDSSPNRHASRHAAQVFKVSTTAQEPVPHQVVVSAEKGDNWAYCYVHEDYLRGPTAYPGDEVAKAAKRL